MELFEAIEQRASVRQLRPVEVPNSDLERILDAGRRAPSGMNLQPYELIVIRDRGTLEKLAEAQSCIADVSVAIAVVAHPVKSRYWLEDVAATTENMLLAITALGYATAWIEGEARHKQTLGVPDNLRLVVVLPIGAAAEPTAQGPTRPLAEIVHWERYGHQCPA